tara:strand:+ start:839 stop:1846 length:1008 start_codon:yes stop_codon:yes gene_type:complete
MARVRLNNEYRQKFFNRIKSVFEDENTQEKEAYLQAREDVNEAYSKVFPLAKEVVQRANPPQDVETLRGFKKKYGNVCDVVAKDKCFYFATTKDEADEDKDDVETDDDKKTVQSHFDFGLYGSLNGSDYSSSEDRKAFAYAYYREELKGNSLNPDIICQMRKKDDNPHKTKHIEANDKFLGYDRYSSRNSDDDESIGLTRKFDSQWYVDIVGTSHCRQRAIPCSRKEFEIFMGWRGQKGKLIAKHQAWIDSLEEQYQKVKEGLRAYRYMEEAIEFCTQLGIKVEEAEMVRANSTGLIMYEPTNLANYILGLKNKTKTREQKIAERLLYNKQHATN